MQISSNINYLNNKIEKNSIKTDFTEKISKEEANEIRAKIRENANDFALKSVNLEGKLVSGQVDISEAAQDFQTFLQDIGYDGKPIAELSQEEASALVSEDGIFGIKQTSERIANFVISGAGANEDMLRAGREGMLQGFKDAQDMWGDELPDISQKTMKAALEIVDKEMMSLGYSLLDQEA